MVTEDHYLLKQPPILEPLLCYMQTLYCYKNHCRGHLCDILFKNFLLLIFSFEVTHRECGITESTAHDSDLQNAF